MRIEELHYTLGPENIACEPPEVRLGRRDRGRLLVIDRSRRERHHSLVAKLPEWLNPGDVLVLNNSKRLPGVLKGRTEAGAQVEVRFASLEDDRRGLCRPYPPHCVTEGTTLHTSAGDGVRVLRAGIPPYGLAEVESVTRPLPDILRAEGLPITSFFSQGYWKLENYNNVYATEEGSIESPMAGMHFTEELLEDLRASGVEVCFITLHSRGSWLPFLEEEVGEHQMIPEHYHIPEETARAVAEARSRGSRVLACGSTVMRTLESAAREDGTFASGSSKTQLYISPGYRFRAVDLYFTNFHTYRSSLMVLDASFCSADLLLESYRDAAKRGYLFHEFGDAVLYL